MGDGETVTEEAGAPSIIEANRSEATSTRRVDLNVLEAIMTWGIPRYVCMGGRKRPALCEVVRTTR